MGPMSEIAVLSKWSIHLSVENCTRTQTGTQTGMDLKPKPHHCYEKWKVKHWCGHILRYTLVLSPWNDYLQTESFQIILILIVGITYLFVGGLCHFRYTYDQRYDRALEIYLRLRHKDVYQLIHKHNLFSSIEDKIVLLMDFDKEVTKHRPKL